MSHLRGQMSGRVGELQGSVQKFSARWFELKPKKLDATKREDMMEIIARVKEWHAEFEEVNGAAARLVEDCEHFSIAPPQLVGLDDVKADIEAYVSSCAVFEEYMTQLYNPTPSPNPSPSPSPSPSPTPTPLQGKHGFITPRDLFRPYP